MDCEKSAEEYSSHKLERRSQKISASEKFEKDKVDILLGTDYAHLQGVVKSCIGKPGEPIAEFTPLGVAFCGKLKNCITKKQNGNYTGFAVSPEYITLTSIVDVSAEEVCIQKVEESTLPEKITLDIVPETMPLDVAPEAMTLDIVPETNHLDIMPEKTAPDIKPE